jgi:hypothetical protein
MPFSKLTKQNGEKYDRFNSKRKSFLEKFASSIRTPKLESPVAQKDPMHYQRTIHNPISLHKPSTFQPQPKDGDVAIE